VVRVNTTFVSVPVQVRDGKGRYIPDLRQQDFNLFEDEAVQQIAYFAGVDEPFTVALLLDTSASARSELGRIQRAAMAFVDQLRANDRVLVVAFDDQIRAMTEPTAEREVLHRAILSTRTGDGTSLYDAVNFVIKQRLRRLPGRKAVVLFTDGEDSASRHATYAANVRDAEQSGLLCYTIMYTNFPQRLDWMRPVPPAYLRDLARHTGGRYYRLTPKDTLAGTFALIAEELRRQYSLGYYPPTPESKANRKIKVRVSKSDAVVRSRESYLEGEGGSPAGQR
jgi:VWFA-related protein